MNEQQQGAKVDVNLVLKVYKEKLEKEISEGIMKEAYISQLENMVQELQRQLEEATTVVEHDVDIEER